MKHKRSTLSLSVCLCVCLTACGLTPSQQQQVDQFGTSTETLASTTQERFQSMRDAVVELERRRLILRNETPPPAFDLDGGLSTSGIATQMAILRTLEAYGHLLAQLATSDRRADVARAANDFFTQYAAARKQGDPNYRLSKPQQKALAEVVAIADSWFLQREKKRLLKRIVETYTDDITALSALLEGDLILSEYSLCAHSDQSTTQTTGIIDIYCTSADAVQTLSSDVLRAMGQSFPKREFAYDSYVLARQAKEEIATLSGQGQQTIHDLTQANNELLKVVRSGHYTTDDIKRYAEQVSELRNHLQVLTGRK